MTLKDIFSIAGKPGLYKMISSTKMPFIVEELESKKRIPVFAKDRVTSLGDISIYTEEDDVPLSKVFEAIRTKHDGSQVNYDEVSASSESLHAFLNDSFSDYDKERVHDGDIKKMAKWYNILIGEGFETFAVEEDDEATTEATETNEE